MEQPPPPPPPPSFHLAKNRVSLGPPLMDPEVIEVPPPVHRASRNRKQKQAALPDIIDVDGYEDYSTGHSAVNGKSDMKDKGKAVQVHSSAQNDLQAEELLSQGFGPMDDAKFPVSSASEFDDKLTDMPFTDGVFDHDSADFMEIDMYETLQSYFDSVDLPTGIEVPLPFFSHSINSVNGNNSSSKSYDVKPVASEDSSLSPVLSDAGPGDVFNLPAAVPPGSLLPQTNSGKQQFVETQSSKSKDSSRRSPWKQPQPHPTKKSSYSLNPRNFFPPKMKIPFIKTGSSSSLSPPAPFTGLQVQVGLSQSTGFTQTVFPAQPIHPFYHNSAVHDSSAEDASRTPKNVADFWSKFQQFKQFDTVEDYSDHHYASSASSAKQPSKTWAKTIQEEWKILERDLPDMIYVRVYESRMDLLRAVIIGAEGTPYHDGLFFFDVLFPDRYPNVPPQVYYHSGGLRLNPNLYCCGKVCLSLLGTWSGSKNEKWLSGTSTMLQVLVSIQALILNKKPFFNEPGYERMSGQPEGELKAQRYNEDAFILSIKTMVYTMKRPPKHFEDFVFGHFYSRAQDILHACKAYMDGAPVGCMVKGGVQDVDESASVSSPNFKQSLPEYLEMLAKELKLIGVPDCDRYVLKPSDGTVKA